MDKPDAVTQITGALVALKVIGITFSLLDASKIMTEVPL